MRIQKINTFVLAMVLSVFAALAGGCQDSKIPLFNSNARPLNRVASAHEVIGELNNQVANLVAEGLITQDHVDKNVGPFLDRMSEGADAAEALVRAKDFDAAKIKLDDVSAGLKQLRSALTEIERSKR